MIRRAWFLISVLWALTVCALDNPSNPVVLGIAIAPFIVAPAVTLAWRYVRHGSLRPH